MILPKTLALSVQLIIPVAAADGVPQLKSTCCIPMKY
jgi:hypothetical protein